MKSDVAERVIGGPEVVGGYWVWSGAVEGVEVRFVGRRVEGGEEEDRREVLAALGVEREVAWVKQLHSSRVVGARQGRSGEGDALVGDGGLALSVVTADCVPVLIAAGERVAAVHAGWRGIADGIVAATVARLVKEAEAAGEEPDPSAWSAWIGPAIGACCYEVGPDVAERVRAESAEDAVLPQPGGRRPHLDLPIAAVAQLARAGIGTVRPVLWCTRCEPDRLHSYRRDQQSASRNHAFIWRR